MEALRRYWAIGFEDIRRDEWRKHGLLFVLTLVSTTITGYSMSGPEGASWLNAFGYSIPVMIILTSHEMGHYLQARIYRVPTTLPYFIPLPLISPFGTLGAFIRMNDMPRTRRALFDIAYWGPAMSFFVSIPFVIIGLQLSTVEQLPQDFQGLMYGESLLFQAIAKLMYDVPPGADILIHPMAFAGWAGLFLTAINLFPIGQLDGGHIAYAMLGKRHQSVSYLFLGILLLLSLEFFGWIPWIFLLLFLGIQHPPISAAVGAEARIDRSRYRKGFFSLIMLVLCFIPVPVKVQGQQEPSPVPREIETKPQEQRWQAKTPLQNPIQYGNSLHNRCA